MKLAFAGFRHYHIMTLYNMVKDDASVTLTGCFEENEDAKKAAENNGVTFNYNSYEEILKDSDVEAVAIGDYYGKRGKMVIDALKAGKHIICDKPICTDLSELDEIEKLSKEKNLQVCCMFDLRYMPQIPKVCEIVKNGDLGKIVNMSFTGQHCLDYGKRPMWYFEEWMHGGTVNDIAIHGIDLIRYLTGMDITYADAVRTWNSYATEEPGFKDCAMLMARLENGAGVMADISYSSPSSAPTIPSYWEFRFWCQRGMMEFGYSSPEVRIYKEGEREVIRVQGENTGKNWLTDLLYEIDTGDRTATRSALLSTEQTLWLQAQAED